MEIPERLDVRSVIQRNNQNNTKVGLVLLFAVPAIAFVIGLGIQGMERRHFPTLIEVIMGLSILIGVCILISVFNSKRHPEKHSAFDWPEAGTPGEVLQAIENSWNQSPADQKERFSHSYYLIPDWLTQMDGNFFDAWPLKELVWAFYSVKSKYINGVPTGTSRNVNLRFITPSHFTSIAVDSDEAAAELLFALQKRAPWAFYGHTEENHRAWNKEKQAMVAAVRERHKAVMAGQQVQQSEQPLQSEPIASSFQPTPSAPEAPPKPPPFDL